MNILVAEALELSFGQQEILRGEGFAVARSDRIGLIGANGSGKTTLLRVLCGRQQLDAGTLHFAKGASIGYLPQDILELPEGRLLQSVIDAAPGRSEIASRLAGIEQALEEATEPQRSQ